MIKKTSFFFLLILLSFFSILSAQNETQGRLLPLYFRTDPKTTNLAEIIDQIEKGTGAKKDTLINKTDTSAFYYRAFSVSFNPFQIPVNGIEFQIREGYGIRDNKIDGKIRFLLMEIIAISDSTVDNESRIKSEYKRLKKEFSDTYHASMIKKSKKKNKRPFERYEFSSRQTGQKNIFLSWGGYYQNANTHCLSLALLYELQLENKN